MEKKNQSTEERDKAPKLLKRTNTQLQNGETHFRTLVVELFVLSTCSMFFSRHCARVLSRHNRLK